MRKYILTLTLATGFFLTGCSQETVSFEETETYQQLKDEIRDLKEEVRDLKVENGRIKTENMQLKKSYETLLKRQRD